MPLDSNLHQSLQQLQDLSLGSTEQDVREDFIKPLLELLGYRSGTENAIERNVSLKVSYVKIGTKKINISTFPDYVLSVASVRKWVLDAKKSSESVLSVEHIFQVHSYAMHKEINVPLYGLCNGNELALYRTTDNTDEPVFYIRRDELIERWEELYQLLSVEGFQERLNYQTSQQLPKSSEKSPNDTGVKQENLIDKEPLTKVIIPRKQASPVHARTHPYFTRRPWNVIQEYIRYYSNREGGGNSGFIQYYRYFIPKQAYPELNVWSVFEAKYRAIYKAKLKTNIDIGKRYQNLQIFQVSATDMLQYIQPNSVDYIYTDPPYGAKISYLDLSTIWNAWLKLSLNTIAFQQEAIEGGSRKKTLEEYDHLLAESLQQMAQVLKPDRWMSIVFVSEKPAHWHTIYETCTQLGLEYVNTVRQPSDRKTPRKIKNPLRHFCGEMVINFRKRHNPVVQAKSKLDRDVIDIFKQTVELAIINNNGSATTEEVNDAVITELLSSGYLQEVTEKVSDFGELLKEYFDYDRDLNVWKIKPKTKLGSYIPLDKRIQFYLKSAFNKAQRLNQRLTIDDLVAKVIPYLRNGTTPHNQDLLSELEKIAYPSGDGIHWELNTGTQLALKLD